MMQNISSRRHPVKSEAGRPLCQGCLSVDRDLVPFVDNTGLFWYLLGHLKFSLECRRKCSLLCWECTTSFKKIWRFQKQIQTAQLLLQQTYFNDTTLQSLSTLTTVLNKDSEIETKHEESPVDSNIKEIEKHSNNEDAALEVNLDKQIISIKQETEEFNIHEFSDEDRNEINEFSEEAVKDEEIKVVETKKEEVKKEKAKKRYRQNEKVKVTMNCDIDLENVDNNYTKVYVSEEKIDDMLEREKKKGMKYRYRCKHCKRRYKISLDLKRHMTFKHETQSGGPYNCLECKTSVATWRALHTHWAQHNCVYQCKVCGALHQQQASARRHVMSHAHIYTCCACDSRFMLQDDFKQHYKELHQQFICDHCGKVCTSRHSIQKHMIIHHLPPRCHLCKRDFKSYRALDRHNREWHPHLTRAQCSKESAYCVECDKQYISLEKYRRHLATAVVHIRKPTKKVKIPCPECGKIFKRKVYMSNHYKLFHLKRSSHYCKLCDKYFVNPYSARKHKLAVHDKVPALKTKVCDICGRAFATNRILTNHRRTHTGERPHKCKYCASAFAQSSALVTHVRTQHSPSV